MPLAWTFDMRASLSGSFIIGLTAVAASDPAIAVEAAFFRISRRRTGSSLKSLFLNSYCQWKPTTSILGVRQMSHPSREPL